MRRFLPTLILAFTLTAMVAAFGIDYRPGGGGLPQTPLSTANGGTGTADPGNIAGTANQVVISGTLTDRLVNSGDITFSLPQSIATTSDVIFRQARLASAAAGSAGLLINTTTNPSAATAVLVPSGTAFWGLQIRALASQSGRLFACTDSAGAHLASFDAVGTLTCPSIILTGGALPEGQGGTGVTSFTQGSVVFGGATTLTESSSAFVYDTDNTRLGVGTPTPAHRLEVAFGDIAVTSGNLLINTAGNGLVIKEGTDARMGNTTLSGGTVFVSNTLITAATRIFLTRRTIGSGFPGFIYAPSPSPGSGFTINSTNALDDSDVRWLLVESQ